MSAVEMKHCSNDACDVYGPFPFVREWCGLILCNECVGQEIREKKYQRNQDYREPVK